MVGLTREQQNGPATAQDAGRTASLVARGGAVVAGWLLHDLATGLVSGRPALALEIQIGRAHV